MVGKFPYRSSWKAGAVLFLLALSVTVLPMSCKSKQKAVELSTSTSATVRQHTATDLQAVIQWLSIPTVYDTLVTLPDTLHPGAPRFTRGLQAGTTTITIHHTAQTDSSSILDKTYRGHEFTKSEAHDMLKHMAMTIFLLCIIVAIGIFCLKHL